MRGQLEKSQTELQRKSETLRQAEAKSQEESRRIETLQQELEREKAKNKLPPMSDKDFLKLCDSGDAKKIEEAIMNGANVNAKYSEGYGLGYIPGYTALMLAARNGDTRTAELLLKNGADVNAKDSTSRTALMRAAYYGYKETAEALLKHGADVNAKDNIGMTALMLIGNTETAKLLRRYGAKE